MSDRSFAPVLRSIRRLLGRAEGDQTADGALLERYVQAGDGEAFAELVRRHGPMVWGVCRRVLRQTAAAEDAFQATFLVFARKARSVRSGGSLGGWLYRVAHRLALAAKASLARQETLPGDVLDTSPADPAQEVAWRETRGLLDEQISRLPEKYRLPVVLCFLEGRTHAEAAAELSWPLGTVAGRLARAKEVLHRELTRRGVTLSLGSLGSLLAAEAAQAITPVRMAAVAQAAQVFAAGLATEGLGSGQAALLAKGMLGAAAQKKVLLGVAALALASLGVLAGVTAYQRAAPSKPGGDIPAAQQPAPLPEPRLQVVLPPPTSPQGFAAVEGLSLSGDGKLLAAIDSGRCLALWDATTGKRLWCYHRPWKADVQSSVSLSADGKLVAVAARSLDAAAALLVDTATGKEIRFFYPTRPPAAITRNNLPDVHLVSLSGDGKLLATGGYLLPWNAGAPDHWVILWDTATGKEIHTLRGHTGAITGVCLSGNGKLLATRSEDRTVILWDTASGKKLHTLQDDSAWNTVSNSNNALSLSADGKLLATGSGKGVSLWDTASGKRIRTFAGFWYVSLSGDGKLLATLAKDPAPGAAGWRAVLWDTATGKEIHTFRGHPSGVNPVYLSADGKRLGTARDSDCTTRLWDTATGKELGALVSFDGTLGWLGISPQGWFDCSEAAWPHVLFRGPGTDRVVDDDATRRRLHRPDLLARTLRGEKPG